MPFDITRLRNAVQLEAVEVHQFAPHDLEVVCSSTLTGIHPSQNRGIDIGRERKIPDEVNQWRWRPCVQGVYPETNEVKTLTQRSGCHLRHR